MGGHEYVVVISGGMCQNTENKTKWVLRYFDNWLKQRHLQSANNDSF